MNILFLGGGRRLSLFQCFEKACAAEGVPAKLFSYELSRFVPVASIATVIEGREWDSPNFAEDLLDVVKRHNIRVVVPLMNGAATALSMISDEVQNIDCWPAVSNYSVCRMCEDKRATEAWFNEHHVRTPLSYPKCNSRDLIAKPRFGFGGRGIERIRLEDVKRYEERDYLIQAIVEGLEYSVDAYVSKDGTILGSVSRRRLRIADGEVINSLTIRRESLLKEAERILKEGHFRGPVTLQAIEQDNSYWFIDINPRFGGGVVLSIHAGADFPRLLIREVMGRSVQPVMWKENILMTRSHQEVFFDLNV